MKQAILFSVLMMVAFSACVRDNKDASAQVDTRASLKGAISYRDNFEIPETSDISVQLLDITEGLEQATIVGDTTFKAEKTTIPFPFVVRYDKDLIQPDRKYALNADISFVTVNLYYTLEPVEVLNAGPKNNVSMILVKGPKPAEEITE